VALEDNTQFGSSARRRQQQLRKLLEQRDQEAICNWAAGVRTPFRALTSLLFDREELIVWRSIEAFRLVAGLVGQRDLEAVRRQLGRLLWTMNDESAAICWRAPEAIAEILIGVPSLATEFGTILMSFLDEEPFEAGVRWAISRLVKENPSEKLSSELPLMAFAVRKSLSSPDPRIRGNALLALESLKDKPSQGALDKLTGDTAPINVYDTSSGEIQTVSVGELAKRALTVL